MDGHTGHSWIRGKVVLTSQVPIFRTRSLRERKKGNWIAQISILDLDRAVTFSFDIWENGTARLDVSDVNREHISFLGNIETANKR